MNWKFWQWDVTGSKRIARLEKRVEELEKEVGIGGSTLYEIMSYSFYNRLWGGDKEERKPIRLHDKVSLIQRHLKISIERGSCETVVKKVSNR